MTAFIMRANKVVQISGIVVQAFNLALTIAQKVSERKANSVANSQGTESQQDGE